jgi:hypothetical protein
MKTRHFPYLLCLLLLCLSSRCIAQQITVRVIDARNGHPLQKRQISIKLFYCEGKMTPLGLFYCKGETTPPAQYDQTLRFETDVNGEARFQLSEPVPAHLTASVDITEEHWFCGCLLSVATQDVVQKGITGPKPGYGWIGPHASVKPVPGEILVLARPWTPFERIWIPLLAPLERG